MMSYHPVSMDRTAIVTISIWSAFPVVFGFQNLAKNNLSCKKYKIYPSNPVFIITCSFTSTSDEYREAYSIDWFSSAPQPNCRKTIRYKVTHTQVNLTFGSPDLFHKLKGQENEHCIIDTFEHHHIRVDSQGDSSAQDTYTFYFPADPLMKIDRDHL